MREVYRIETRGGGHIYDSLRAGDYVLSFGNGRLFGCVSHFLGKIEPAWLRLQRKPWHMAFVVNRSGILCESYPPRVRIIPIDSLPVGSYRVYRWFENPLDTDRLDKFIKTRLGCRYDVDCYLWTCLFYFLKRLARLPRIMDRRFTCWELAADLALWFGDPWHDMYSYPLITDFLMSMGHLKGKLPG